VKPARANKELVRFALRHAGIFDVAFSTSIRPLIPWIKLTKRMGLANLPRTREMFISKGFLPLTNHYYEPFFDPGQLARPISRVRSLPGLYLDEEKQLDLLRKLNFSAELEAFSFPQSSSDQLTFAVNNGSFVAGDFDFLYQFLRHTRPGKIIEIGSGNSTKIMKLALEKNAIDEGRKAKHICIEPFEQPWLESIGVDVIRRKVEECDIALFVDLNAGDLLFIDSSHVIRPQGDVLFELLQVVPSLKEGVYVHVHDIFSPRDYLDTYVIDHMRLWNEQYMLEALLSHTDRYAVVAALNFLKHDHYEALRACCPYLKPVIEPSSFYFQVRSTANALTNKTRQ
jgi:Methyltransferase domain